jgi:nickel-dependent lactate racemase
MTKIRKGVWVNRIVAEADLVIVIGTIVPHLMAGFSGGAKGIIPGVAGLKTIGLNHILMLHPRSRLGVIEGNILREDMERTAGLLKNVFIINAVYDKHRQVVGLVGGDMIQAHREGVRLCREIGEVKVKKADIVISCDAYPETINIYQTIKLIAPAARAVKAGGIIICAGECPEGEGELSMFNRLFYWMVIRRILPKGVSIYLLSEAGKTKNFPFFLKPIASIEEGIEKGFKKIGPDASILILSGAGLLIPRS